MNCNNCGHTIPKGAKFCMGCGQRVTACCASCGSELSDGAKFCMACGAAVASEAPKKSEPSLIGYCAASGKAIHPDDPHFKCLECGKLYLESQRFEDKPICQSCAYESGMAQVVEKNRAEHAILEAERLAVESAKKAELETEKQVMIEATRVADEERRTINEYGKDGETKLTRAIEKKDINEVQELLIKGANPNKTSEKESEVSNLNIAVTDNSLEIIKLLIEAGAIIDDKESIALLNAALKNKALVVIKQLVSSGANLLVDTSLFKDIKSREISKLIAQLPADELDTVLGVYECVPIDFLFSEYQCALHSRGTGKLKVLIKYGKLKKLEKVHDSDGDNLFFAPYGWDSSELFNYLVQLGVNPAHQNKHQSTPLHVAAKYGSFGNVKLLINAGVDVNVMDESGLTPLQKAIMHDYIDIMALLLKEGAEHSIVSKKGWSPLHNAVARNNLEMVSILLDAGADPNVESNGLTPLKKAVGDKASVDLIHRLIEGGADPNYYDDEEYKFSILHQALRDDEVDIPIVKELLSGGATPNAPSHIQLGTPFHCVIRLANNLNLIDLFLKYGAEINKLTPEFEGSQSMGKATPLHISLNNRDESSSVSMQVVSKLITAGANVNAADVNGKRPIHYACMEHVRNRQDLIHLLVEHGASVNVADEEGETPLHYELHTRRLRKYQEELDVTLEEKRSYGVFEELILAGADPSIRDNDGDTVQELIFGYSGEYTDEDILRLIYDLLSEATKNVERKNKKESILYASFDSATFDLHMLIQESTDPDEWCSSDSDTLVGIVRCLNRGADPNTKDAMGRSALGLMIELNKTKGLVTLMENGANPNITDSIGTPLIFHAVENIRPIDVEYLIKYGCDLNVKDSSGTKLVNHLHEALHSKQMIALIKRNAKKGWLSW